MTLPLPDGVPLFADPRIEREIRADGTHLLRSQVRLPQSPRSVSHWLVDWARESPERVFLAERPDPAGPWVELSYGAAHAKVRNLAGWILKERLSPERPLVILSENSVDHALFALAAMHVGVPAATISPAYALMSEDHAKLKAMIALLEPGAIYAADGAQYGRALAALAPLHRAPVIVSRAPSKDHIPFADLLSGGGSPAVDTAFAEVGPDTIARFLFTSGSTGTPKAVINTQRMLCTNQEARALIWPFLEVEPPVILDWLPWNHTFGANHNFNMVLRNGGTLFIDSGKPVPELIGRTAANLKSVSPTVYFNVPRGYDMLISRMSEDRSLRDRFFGTVRILFYSGAALPQNLWEALDELSRAATGRPTPMVSAWGSTETAPLATDCHFQAERSGNIGVPVPGTELKLVPGGGKLEIRVRGPNITPGYWKQPDLTQKAFDGEGFYCIGDAVRFADADDPGRGLYFDGRVSEDFKLATGTWVSVGALRVAGIAALAPIAQDIVIAGHDRDFVGFLVFPNAEACRKLAGLPADAPLDAALGHPAVRARLAEGLAALKAEGKGSSAHAARAVLLAEPPDVDAGEITDKGYINQNAVLTRRETLADSLFANPPGPQVVLCP